MSPSGIFLFEIDENFGPKIIADYYLSSQKVVPEALKKLSDKHKKDLIDATYKKDKNRYYSSKISAGSIKEHLFLGFQLKEDEDLVSLKSLFENIEQKIAQNFTKDRRQMQNYLKERRRRKKLGLCLSWTKNPYTEVDIFWCSRKINHQDKHCHKIFWN